MDEVELEEDGCARALSLSLYFSSLFSREVKLSVVSYLTNSIVDQILQDLYATHKTLVWPPSQNMPLLRCPSWR